MTQFQDSVRPIAEPLRHKANINKYFRLSLFTEKNYITIRLRLNPFFFAYKTHSRKSPFSALRFIELLFSAEEYHF